MTIIKDNFLKFYYKQTVIKTLQHSYNNTDIKKTEYRAEEISQYLRALACFSEYQTLITSTYTTTHNNP